MTRTLALGALTLTLALASPLAAAHDDNAAYFLLGAAVGSAVQQDRGIYRGPTRWQGHRYLTHSQRHRWRAMKRHHRQHRLHGRHIARRDHWSGRHCDRYQAYRNGYRQDYWRDEGPRHHRNDRDRPRRYR